MSIKPKLELLISEIDSSIKFFEFKHKRTKRRAYGLKITAVSFSAMVTVLLGVNISGMSDIFKNMAIVLGGLVTIISAIEAFYDYSGLWVKSTITLVKLNELKRKIIFCTIGENPEELDMKQLEKYMEQLQNILKTDLKEWLRIREKIASQDEKKEDTISAEKK